MNAYFFKMSKEERDNILDQHKEPYNGYIMQNQTSSNEQPLYVQDFANDKQGINIDIHGNAKPYTNFRINESHLGLDMIGDGEVDLKNGTVDFEDVLSHNDNYDFGFDYPETDSYENNVMVGDDNEDDSIYVSLGEMDDMIGGGEDDLKHGTFGSKKTKHEKIFDGWSEGSEYNDEFSDENEKFYNMKNRLSDKENDDDNDFNSFFDVDEIGTDHPLDDEELESLKESIERSKDMFRRFKNY